MADQIQLSPLEQTDDGILRSSHVAWELPIQTGGKLIAGFVDLF